MTELMGLDRVAIAICKTGVGSHGFGPSVQGVCLCERDGRIPSECSAPACVVCYVAACAAINAWVG